jgi:ribose 5-phosphate isomerase B
LTSQSIKILTDQTSLDFYPETCSALLALLIRTTFMETRQGKAMKIAIGSDHAGFTYKQKIITFLTALGHEVKDFGTFSDASCDYPDFIFPVAKAVSAGEYDRGIVLGGSGNGEAMAANRIKGIRAAVCWNDLSAEMARRHNDANVLSLGQRMIAENALDQIVTTWLDTPFEAGRHLGRILKIDKM